MRFFFVLPLACVLALTGCDSFASGFDPTPPDLPLPPLGTCIYTVTDENGATTTIEQLARFSRQLDSGTAPALVVCDVDGEVGLLDLPYLRLSGVNEDEFLTVPVGESFNPIADYVKENGALYYNEQGQVTIDVRDEERIGGRFRFRTLLFQSARNPPEVIVEGTFHAPVVDE